MICRKWPAEKKKGKSKNARTCLRILLKVQDTNDADRVLETRAEMKAIRAVCNENGLKRARTSTRGIILRAGTLKSEARNGVRRDRGACEQRCSNGDDDDDDSDESVRRAAETTRRRMK